MRIASVMTFVDLPIRKKFLIFSGGVLFWFAVMFLITVAALVNVNDRSGQIVNKLIVEERTAQKIVKELRSPNVDTAELIRSEDAGGTMRLIETAKARLAAANSLLLTLNSEGQAKDPSSASMRPIAISTATPSTERADDEGYIDNYIEELSPLLAGITQQFGALAQLKLVQQVAPRNENTSPEKQFGNVGGRALLIPHADKHSARGERTTPAHACYASH